MHPVMADMNDFAIANVSVSVKNVKTSIDQNT